jgi:hypothetical protein
MKFISIKTETFCIIEAILFMYLLKILVFWNIGLCSLVGDTKVPEEHLHGKKLQGTTSFTVFTGTALRTDIFNTFIYLFIYLMTLSIAHTALRRMVE